MPAPRKLHRRSAPMAPARSATQEVGCGVLFCAAARVRARESCASSPPAPVVPASSSAVRRRSSLSRRSTPRRSRSRRAAHRRCGQAKRPPVPRVSTTSRTDPVAAPASPSFPSNSPERPNLPRITRHGHTSARRLEITSRVEVAHSTQPSSSAGTTRQIPAPRLFALSSVDVNKLPAAGRRRRIAAETPHSCTQRSVDTHRSSPFRRNRRLT